MMVSTVAGALIFVEGRRLIQVVPDSLIKFLNYWQLRVFVIVSLILQILLITLGNRRKYVYKIWIRITLWCAYLLADWVATVSLGTISKNTISESQKQRKTEDPLNQLMWFWAQFFLLHLGGPDTITAYSLEDNELWLRHLVGMVIQTGIAFYVLLVAFPGSSWLPILSMLIFVAGVIKYGERLFALRASNSENFRNSMLTEPEPGPNYAKIMGECTLRRAEGYYVQVDEATEIDHVPHAFPDLGLVPAAYHLFLKFRRLFADEILSFQDRDSSRTYFLTLLADQAFNVVEVELGFMFDELYTKASVVYNVGGFVLRMITFCSTSFALMAFVFFCEKSKYKKLDLIITYLLLVVAVCLEIYAVWGLINSDWSSIWLSKQDRGNCSFGIIGRFQRPNKRRWSKKMAQHNLLDLCVRDKTAVWLRSLRKLIPGDNYLEKHWYNTFVDVSPELKNMIFSELQGYSINEDPTSWWNQKGSFTLQNYGHLSRYWNNRREFDQIILLWHIATDICYSQELGNNQENADSDCEKRKQISKHISDYMLYLLVACPFMLPIGIGMIRFRDTCAEAKEILEERKVKSSKADACEYLLHVTTKMPQLQVKRDRSKSVLFDACKLVIDFPTERGQKWQRISKAWVDLLAHAATRCSGNHHARQLRKGGELLTHVWLLMAHLGITEQFQISEGHARVQLIVA